MRDIQGDVALMDNFMSPLFGDNVIFADKNQQDINLCSAKRRKWDVMLKGDRTQTYLLP